MMKGLLIKDYKTILHNKSLFFILAVVQLLALQNYDNYTFLIGYTVMISAILTLNTITLDEYYKSSPFLMTMPIRRETYVTEKYALMLGVSFLGFLFSITICILLHREMALMLLFEGFLTYFVLALFQLLMLPAQLKFGGEKGRAVLISLLACVAVVVSSFSKNLVNASGIKGDIGNLIRNAVTGFLSLPAGRIAFIAIRVFAVCLILSYCVSLRIMRGKEF